MRPPYVSSTSGQHDIINQSSAIYEPVEVLLRTRGKGKPVSSAVLAPFDWEISYFSGRETGMGFIQPRDNLSFLLQFFARSVVRSLCCCLFGVCGHFVFPSIKTYVESGYLVACSKCCFPPGILKSLICVFCYGSSAMFSNSSYMAVAYGSCG